MKNNIGLKAKNGYVLSDLDFTPGPDPNGFYPTDRTITLSKGEDEIAVIRVKLDSLESEKYNRIVFEPGRLYHAYYRDPNATPKYVNCLGEWTQHEYEEAYFDLQKLIDVIIDKGLEKLVVRYC